MSKLSLKDVHGYVSFDADECAALGSSLRSTYVNAKPFPHIVLENFLDDELLRQVAAAYPDSTGKTFFDRHQEKLKYQYKPAEARSALARNLFAELNGGAFLSFLEEMTGIERLLPDPYFEGGGLHETKRGGHLSVHADFNLHSKLKLERRLNLLIYLNDNWLDSFGGSLELWDREMRDCQIRVAPTLGRAVVFSTNSDSYHGHPDPLTCPAGTTRKSIATYYYTADPAALEGIQPRTTNFKVRPGSLDRTDWKVRGLHFINDWVPPRLQPKVGRLLRFVK